MPIRWTPEKDQYILETSQINADVKAISEKWADGGEIPTPRAIQERLFKIRSMAKGRGEGSPKVSGTVRSTKTGNTPKDSPAKPKTTPNKAKTPTKNTPSKTSTGGKRKLSDESSDTSSPETKFKTENNDTDASDSEAAPMITPKAKRAKTAGVKVEGEDLMEAGMEGNIGGVKEI
ncbi:MAG: hypothetical protein LQ350_005322 [Teloschistes chrysophthalmus]|nr:MAG: hypothetical protein LQ350_005322 [Niorma chrysophthalma]